MTSYSNKSLIEKLGIKETFTMKLINPPGNYFHLITVPKTLLVGEAQVDFIHCFVKELRELVECLPRIKEEIHKDGMIWISWPKKSSELVTDLNENIIREHALNNGLVDVKVCAIDDTWSGLKLVFRKKDR